MTKIAIILFFAALIISEVTSYQQLSCNKENLMYFQESVKINTSPTKERNYYACHDEFLKYHTCCDSESLKAFIEKGVEADALRWNNAIKSFSFFKKEVLAKKEQLEKKIKEVLPKLKIASDGGKIKREVLDAAITLEKVLPTLTKEGIAESVSNFKSSQGCFDELMTLRKNGVCLVCSGRSQTFFTGRSLNIKERTCSSIVKSCLDTFRFNFKVMGALRAMFDMVNKLDTKPSLPQAIDAINYNSTSQ